MYKYFFKLKFHYNLFFLFILILYVKNQENIKEYSKIIEYNKVCIEYLNNSKGIELRWLDYYQGLIVHILSLDGKIIIKDKEQTNLLTKISHYNYDAYFIDYNDNYYLRLTIYSLNLFLLNFFFFQKNFFN